MYGEFMQRIMKRRGPVKLRTLLRGRNKRRYSLYAKIDWRKAESLFQRPQVKEEQERKYPPVRDILRVIAAAGAIGMLFAFPHSAPGIALLFGLGRHRDWEVNAVVKTLVRQKYVSVIESPDGKTTVRITKKGMTKALTYELDTMQILKPKKWDKRWRVVIFDVPEKYKDLRNAFRVRLRQLGLFQLQESVYVSPYPCFDEIEFLRELYGVAFATKYLLVEKIEDDISLREHFGLAK